MQFFGQKSFSYFTSKKDNAIIITDMKIPAAVALISAAEKHERIDIL